MVIETAQAFESSQMTYKASERRSLGPTMALYAAQCYFIGNSGGDGDWDNKDTTQMIEEVTIYKEIDELNWTRPDRMVFRSHDDHLKQKMATIIMTSGVIIKSE